MPFCVVATSTWLTRSLRCSENHDRGSSRHLGTSDGNVALLRRQSPNAFRRPAVFVWMRHSGSSTPALARNSLTLAGRATSGRRTQGGSVRCTAAGTSASQDATRSRATQQTLLILRRQCAARACRAPVNLPICSPPKHQARARRALADAPPALALPRPLPHPCLRLPSKVGRHAVATRCEALLHDLGGKHKRVVRARGAASHGYRPE